MKTTVPNIFLIISSLFLIFPSALPKGHNKEVCQREKCLTAGEHLKESMNMSVNPCDNFYLYACGNWTKLHRNRSLTSQNTLKLRAEENDQEISDFLKQQNHPREPEAFHKSRHFFSLCLKESAYTGRVDQVVNLLQQIGVQDVPFAEDLFRNFDFSTALARANKLAGVKVYFDFRVGPNSYNRTENLFILRKASWPEIDIEAMLKARGQIETRNFIDKIVTAMCKNSPSAACLVPINHTRGTPYDWIIDEIIKFNQDLPKFMDAAPLPPKTSKKPDVNIYSLFQVQTLSDGIAEEEKATIPKLNWTRYIEEMFAGLNDVKLQLRDPHKVQIAIEKLDVFKNMLAFFFTRTNMKPIECDIWWQVISTFLPYADLNIADTKSSLNAQGKLRSIRERRCKAMTINSFSTAIIYGYSTKDKYEKARSKIAKMFNHVRGSFERMIKKSSWVDMETKKKAILKLKSLKTNFLYPRKIRGPSSLRTLYHDIKITHNFFDTMVSIIQSETENKLKTLNQPNNPGKQDWTPPHKVNGFYIPSRNSIIIPAGLVGKSIYYNNVLRSLDYGAIGSILGHELNHVFSELGRYYDENGNIQNWWPNETLKIYEEKANCFVKAYASYNFTFENGLTYYGDEDSSKETLDENISDNVGFKECLLAYRRSVSKLGEERLLPHFQNFTHEQLLTLAYANVLCENPTLTSITSTKQSLHHSLNIIRINGVFKNSREFSQIWKCPENSPMNSSDKCVLW